MKKETLDKLRQYVDLAASQASVHIPHNWYNPSHGAAREQAWREFVEAALVDWYELEELQDTMIALRHAAADLEAL